MSDTKLTIKELAELSLLAAASFTGKMVLSFVPNVHPVALMLIVITEVYGFKAFYCCAIYVALEILCFGFGMWSIAYLYIWAVLVFVCLCLRKIASRLTWTAVACMHGLLFGAMCSIPYFVTGGIGAGISYWVAGIPYDLIHGLSNAVLTFLLYPVLCPLIYKLKNKS